MESLTGIRLMFRNGDIVEFPEARSCEVGITNKNYLHLRGKETGEVGFSGIKLCEHLGTFLMDDIRGWCDMSTPIKIAA